MKHEIDYTLIEGLIKFYEGYSDIPYICPTGHWTIGYGHIIVVNGRQLKGMSDKRLAFLAYPKPITVEEANKLLRADIDSVINAIWKSINVPLNKYQMASLVSFVFNVGIGNFVNSTLLKKLNQGNYDSVPDQLKRWVKGTIDGKKVVLNGLVKRRNTEAEYWQRSG